MTALLWAAVINGLLAPPLLVLIMLAGEQGILGTCETWWRRFLVRRKARVLDLWSTLR